MNSKMNDLQLLLDFSDHFNYECGYCKNADNTFTAFFHGDELHFDSNGTIIGIVKSDNDDN